MVVTVEPLGSLQAGSLLCSASLAVHHSNALSLLKRPYIPRSRTTEIGASDCDTLGAQPGIRIAGVGKKRAVAMFVDDFIGGTHIHCFIERVTEGTGTEGRDRLCVANSKFCP